MTHTLVKRARLMDSLINRYSWLSALAFLTHHMHGPRILNFRPLLLGFHSGWFQKRVSKALTTKVQALCAVMCSSSTHLYVIHMREYIIFKVVKEVIKLNSQVIHQIRPQWYKRCLHVVFEPGVQWLFSHSVAVSMSLCHNNSSINF